MVMLFQIAFFIMLAQMPAFSFQGGRRHAWAWMRVVALRAGLEEQHVPHVPRHLLVLRRDLLARAAPRREEVHLAEPCPREGRGVPASMHEYKRVRRRLEMSSRPSEGEARA